MPFGLGQCTDVVPVWQDFSIMHCQHSGLFDLDIGPAAPALLHVRDFVWQRNDSNQLYFSFWKIGSSSMLNSCGIALEVWSPSNPTGHRPLSGFVQHSFGGFVGVCSWMCFRSNPTRQRTVHWATNFPTS